MKRANGVRTMKCFPGAKRELCGFAMVGLSLWVTGGFLTGCGQPESDVQRTDGKRSDRKELTPDQVARLLETNVVGVAAFYDPFNPWIRSENRATIVGVKLSALYLIGPEGKGVFGDGVIRPKLFVGTRDRLGRVVWETKPAKEWVFTVEDAIPFRSKRPTAFGWGYALFLDWRDTDVSGKDIRLIVLFERSDQTTVTSQGKDLRVPPKV